MVIGLIHFLKFIFSNGFYEPLRLLTYLSGGEWVGGVVNTPFLFFALLSFFLLIGMLFFTHRIIRSTSFIRNLYEICKAICLWYLSYIVIAFPMILYMYNYINLNGQGSFKLVLILYIICFIVGCAKVISLLEIRKMASEIEE